MKFTSEHIQQLLIEKITGTIEADDDLVIEQLLTENREVFLQWQALKDEVQRAEEQGFSSEGNVEKSWQKVAPMVERHARARILSLVRIAAAAVIVAVTISGIYFFNKRNNSVHANAQLSAKEKRSRVILAMDNGETIYLKSTDSSTFQLGSVTIRAKKGAMSYTNGNAQMQQWSTLSVPSVVDYKIKLSDGTEVWMNSKTRLRFPFSFPGKTREVFIDGEAYFKVAKKTGQPFIVHAHETAIKVLGTQFNVNTYDHEKIKTALIEGSVAAASGNNLINLRPGFEATYSTLQKAFKVGTFDQSELLSWMKGVYYFHNNSLKDLSKLLSRWYNVEVIFENPSLQHKTFSGEIAKHQPIQLFLDNISISNDIQLEFKNGVVYFK